MPTPKWLVVARNEYRIRINRIRKIKPYFPYLVIGLLAVYVAFIAPTVVNLFIDDFLAFFFSQVAVAMVPIIMFMIFFYLIILPITYTLQGMQAGQVEIFLAAPIKPSDVLLGEFLGVMPFYAIAITVMAGFFTAALNPLGLDMLQIAITVTIFVVTFLSALWVGTVIAALVRTKFAKSARGRDIGRALSLVLALPMIAVMYAIMGGGLLEALTDPGTSGMVRTILGLLPSSWGAEVIVGFASNPGNIGAVGFETLTRFGGLVFFFVAVLWLGTKAANRAYSIEPTTFTASRAKPDGFFYRTVRYLGGGGSFGTLLASVFKDYGRRLENLSRIAYIVGLIAMVKIFFGGGNEDPEGALIMGLFLFPFLAVLVVGQVTAGGKESVFIYKKTPFGVGRFVKARLLQGLLVAVPIGAAITAVSMIQIPQTTLISLLTYTGFMSQLVAANVALALGLSLMNPEFSGNTRAQMVGLMVNAQVAMFASIGVFIGSMVVLDLGFLNTVGLQTVVIWLLGIVFLYLGKRKLSRIE
ncbi:MAG: ABC transporter permease [Candidatus Bathyarchaeota archaeon]|nr:ABC transporter permease [Candidatus Bathyarchaeota archaeon]MDH5745545.1 ABC transporter permease [Candidatus Bathyarchaeota archaeon]